MIILIFSIFFFSFSVDTYSFVIVQFIIVFTLIDYPNIIIFYVIVGDFKDDTEYPVDTDDSPDLGSEEHKAPI